MTRLLLTLLALLTGLAAQVSPAQARIGGSAGAEVAVQMPGSGRIVAAASEVSSRPIVANVWRVRLCSAFTPQRLAPTRTVFTGIDRARE